MKTSSYTNQNRFKGHERIPLLTCAILKASQVVAVAFAALQSGTVRFGRVVQSRYIIRHRTQVSRLIIKSLDAFDPHHSALD